MLIGTSLRQLIVCQSKSNYLGVAVSFTKLCRYRFRPSVKILVRNITEIVENLVKEYYYKCRVINLQRSKINIVTIISEMPMMMYSRERIFLTDITDSKKIEYFLSFTFRLLEHNGGVG